MSDIAFVTRFAPSPTGRLHPGHAASALMAWEAARAAGGRCLLRIEDIDTTRCRAEYIDGILEDLAWLGLDWETPVRRQSEHLDDYRAALDRLESMGVLYPCICTRREIAAEVAASASAPHGAEGPLYPGICKNRPQEEMQRARETGTPVALRLDMEAAVAVLRSKGRWPLTFGDELRGDTVSVDPALHGDVVLARKDLGTSYHLAVTVDDALQGITHVIRGEDLLTSTHVHRILQALLDLPEPVYRHHPLLTDATGRRLAKRDRALTLQALRERGETAESVRHGLATEGFTY